MKRQAFAVALMAGLVTFAYQGCGPGFINSDLPGSEDFASQELVEKTCGSPRLGRTGARTLSNDEYRNTVRDLLYVEPDFSAILPTNRLGANGFRNDVQGLNTLDIDHMNKFYTAAEATVRSVLATQNFANGPYQKIFFCSNAMPSANAVPLLSMNKLDPRNFTDKLPDAVGSSSGLNFGAQGFEMVRNGRLGQKIFVKKTGPYLVQIKAAQRPMPGADAIMTLGFNGLVQNQFSVTGNLVFANFAATLNLTVGEHQLELGYTNDMIGMVGGVQYDRNLIIQEVVISSTDPTLTALPVGEACTSQIFKTLTARAFRQSESAAEVVSQAQAMVALTKAATSSAVGYSDALISLLMDPRFLLLVNDVETGNRGVANIAETSSLSAFGLASRLSYMLWQSMPDDSLRVLAESGELRQSDVLRAQIKRMLKDAKIKSLTATLRKDWLGLANFESSSFAGLSTALQAAFVTETSMYLEEMIASDRPLSWLLKSEQSYLNKELADLYGVNFPAGQDPLKFVSVPLSQSLRRGIMSQASILASTAGSTTATHPVRRGVWVADRILCSKPAPPPPGVPPLPNDTATEGTIRARLEAHVKSAACLGCHKEIDLYGLGLENYDATGRWRANYSDQRPVESFGNEPEYGLRFNDSKEMIQQISELPRAKACLSETMMRLGSARGLTSFEKCSVGLRGIVAFDTGKPFSDFIYDLVASPEFIQQADKDTSP